MVDRSTHTNCHFYNVITGTEGGLTVANGHSPDCDSTGSLCCCSAVQFSPELQHNASANISFLDNLNEMDIKDLWKFTIYRCVLLWFTSPPLMLTHAHTHIFSLTDIHTRIYACIRVHTHTHTVSLFLTHLQSLSLSLTHTHSLSLSLSHTHTHTLSLSHTHTHTRSLSLSHTHTHPYTHTHTHTHTPVSYTHLTLPTRMVV